MNTTLNYIDDYFTGALNDDEKRDFERRCASDPDFAKEVAEYITIRDGLKSELQQKRKEEFEKLRKELSVPAKPSNIITLRRISYLVAASILLILGWFAFFNRSNPQSTADKYIAANLTTLRLNMGVSDSLQMGMSAYNSKSFADAEYIFKSLASKQEANPDALEDLGLTYLATKQYDEALKSFDQLSAVTLHINKGQFYKALTLMARSKGTDNQQAKQILQEIIDKNLYGNEDARNWIKQIKN
ncbi:MAG TPA: tetratricopeptide repeat protein [Mucilaginibacter sp.]|jgi:tetratricopeptide (TPR) repeat protein